MKRKVVAAIMSVALVAAVGIGGTLAYLSAQTDVVTNTFTVGTGFIVDEDKNEGIYIDETDIDDSTPNKERDTINEYKEVVPGTPYVKDPLVHMVGGSIESYVFVKVDGLKELHEQHVHVYYKTQDGTLKEGVNTSKYTPVQVDDYGDGLYIYTGGKYSVQGAANVVDVSREKKKSDCKLDNVFDIVKMDSDVSTDEFGKVSFTGKEITVQAVAVQYAADEMKSYEDAQGTLPAGWYTAPAPVE